MVNPILAPTSDLFDLLNPHVVSLSLADTAESSLSAKIQMNFTNPTAYSASIPFVDILMLFNGTAIAHITARNIDFKPGNNTNIPIELHWTPFELNGIDGVEAGRTLVSSYISGEY